MKRRDFLLVSMIAGGTSAIWVPPAPAETQDDVDAPSIPPPKYAKVLFDGSSLAGWLARKGGPAAWKVQDGYMEVVPGTGDIFTKDVFGDHQIHVEFWLPLMAAAKGQARANSGVYVHRMYEVQVLDSYGLEPKYDDCGAIYEVAPPLRNACKKPERWQAYDIAFRAPRFDSTDQLKEKARMTVFHNGILIHHGQEIPGSTRAFMETERTKPAPLLLQDHGNRVRYRNIWVIPTP